MTCKRDEHISGRSIIISSELFIILYFFFIGMLFVLLWLAFKHASFLGVKTVRLQLLFIFLCQTRPHWLCLNCFSYFEPNPMSHQPALSNNVLPFSDQQSKWTTDRYLENTLIRHCPLSGYRIAWIPCINKTLSIVGLQCSMNAMHCPLSGYSVTWIPCIISVGLQCSMNTMHYIDFIIQLDIYDFIKQHLIETFSFYFLLSLTGGSFLL